MLSQGERFCGFYRPGSFFGLYRAARNQYHNFTVKIFPNAGTLPAGNALR
jgi:hypothetical protein